MGFRARHLLASSFVLETLQDHPRTAIIFRDRPWRFFGIVTRTRVYAYIDTRTAAAEDGIGRSNWTVFCFALVERNRRKI